MATVAEKQLGGNPDYPTGDGKPMAETDYHRALTVDLIDELEVRYAPDPNVYVSGDLLVFYEPGNKRRHLAPDVFVVKGVPKMSRLNYLIWEEGKPPNTIIEVTSSSTRHKDTGRKFLIYQDRWRVPEYFLFDPFGDYLDPPLKGFRLRAGKYQPIRPVAGRLPSRELGLHLEAHEGQLRLFDPVIGAWLPTRHEVAERAELARDQAQANAREAQANAREAQANAREAQAIAQQAEANAREAEANAHQAAALARQAEALANQEKMERQQAETRVRQAEDEVKRLQDEIADLRRRNKNGRKPARLRRPDAEVMLEFAINH